VKRLFFPEVLFSKMSSSRKVECDISIKAKPASIIAAFMEAEALKKWWNVDRSMIEPTPGGVYLLAWNAGPSAFGYVTTGIIGEYEAHTKLVIEKFCYLNPEKPVLGPMTISIRVEKENNGTICHLCQDGYGEGADWDWYYHAVHGAWPVVLKSLKAYLERKGLNTFLATE
jgi:uncharacterized protein YndB with AHSA1/START domain